MIGLTFLSHSFKPPLCVLKRTERHADISGAFLFFCTALKSSTEHNLTTSLSLQKREKIKRGGERKKESMRER